jgi:hypothetical protein
MQQYNDQQFCKKLDSRAIPQRRTILIIELFIFMQHFATDIETVSLHFLQYGISFFFQRQSRSWSLSTKHWSPLDLF